RWGSARRRRFAMRTACALLRAKYSGSGATAPSWRRPPGSRRRCRSQRASQSRLLGSAIRATSSATKPISTMSKRAVILAGGRGTRLRPYTVVLPKPLMPIGEYPILEVIVRQLAVQGFDRVTMAVNHQANLIQAFFGDGSRWSLQIDYSVESKPLSTVGPLTLIDDLPEAFLLMNGDV